MNKRILILVIVVVASIFAIWEFSLWENTKEKKEEKQKSEISSDDSNYIVVKDTPEGKTAENTKEKISIKIPEGWGIVEEICYEDGEVLGIKKIEVEEDPEYSYLTERASFFIFIYENPDYLTSQEWVINEGRSINDLTFITVEDKEAVQIKTKFPEGIGENNETVYEDDSETTNFYFSSGDKIYRFSCNSRGINYKENAKICEDLAKEKIRALPWVPVINLREVKEGDRIGKLKIESIMPFSKKISGGIRETEEIEEVLPFGSENLSVVFSGEIFVKGNYEFYKENEPFTFNQV